MNSPIPCAPRSHSQAGGRRPATSRPGPLSHLHSDCPPEPEESTTDSPSLGQRSISLTTLQPIVIQPRMAQLETLEAKMASIEVSLSSTPRRKKNGSLGGISLGSSIRSIPKEIAAKELESLRNALRDKENIIQSLKGQLTIPGLRLNSLRNNGLNNNNNNNSNNNNNANNRELTDVEKKQAEERLNRLKTDIDNKRLGIKNLKMALERLDITDNIDVRIQQAELEYQLGREELNLLTLLEETRALQLCLEETNKNSSESHTLFSCVTGEERVMLLGVEIDYDPKSPKFGAGQKDSTPGLWIDWALEETGMCKGDRLVEVNGKIVLMRNRDDLSRLLAAAPDPAQIVILRKFTDNSAKTTTRCTPAINPSKEVNSLRSELEVVRERAEEAQKSKDELRSDNIRLTHRISYLEEQVSELLCRNKPDVRIVSENPVISTVKSSQNITNINITSSQTATAISSSNLNHQKEQLQVFQKGPQVTALVANLPGLEATRDAHTSLPVRSKSSLSNISNTHIQATPNIDGTHHSCHKNHRHKHHRSSTRNNLQTSVSVQNLEQSNSDKVAFRNKHHNHHHHHHHEREKDYSSETNSEHVTRYNNKRNIENGHRYSMDFTTKTINPEKEFPSSNIMDQSYKKATKIVHELTRSKDTNLYEKHRQKCLMASEKYNTDILKHYNARKSTSVLDFRSQIHINSKYSDSKSVEELDAIDSSNNKTIFNSKKIQDARSVKSLDFDSDCNSTNSYSRMNGHHTKNIDYTSEPLENSNRKLSHYASSYYGENMKPRPTPPKKPLRLSLHKTQSLQSVETPPVTPNTSPNKNCESRKRNYKGEVPVCFNLKDGEQNGYYRENMSAQLTSFCNGSIENSGNWC